MIFYETVESGLYLEQVNAFIQRQTKSSFDGTWMMNVYYQDVAAFGGSVLGEVRDFVIALTYSQCILFFRTLFKQF